MTITEFSSPRPAIPYTRAVSLTYDRWDQGRLLPRSNVSQVMDAMRALRRIMLETDPFSTQGGQMTMLNVGSEVIDSTREVPHWHALVEARLAELLAGVGDFTGLARPDAETVQIAWEFAVKTFPLYALPPSVLPTADGEIEFIWHRHGWDVEIAVSRRRAILWAQARDSGEELDEAFTITDGGNVGNGDGSVLRELLEKISG